MLNKILMIRRGGSAKTGHSENGLTRKGAKAIKPAMKTSFAIIGICIIG